MAGPDAPGGQDVLSEIKLRLPERFDTEAFVLWRLVARGQAAEEIVTSRPLSRLGRREIPGRVLYLPACAGRPVSSSSPLGVRTHPRHYRER